MPMPEPRQGETENDFMQRCMGDDTMKKEYPEQDQRSAVCMSQWRRDKEKNRAWYSIKNQEIPEVMIYDEIGFDAFWEEGLGAKQFIQDLKALGNPETIKLRINSPGGDVFDGYAIYNALKSHKARIDVHIDGIAASIASVVAMAGDSITMPSNAMLMMHDPSGMVIGTSADMKKMAEALDKVGEGIAGIYSNKSGLELSQIHDLMGRETWLTATEAEEFGFADVVTDPVKMAAKWDWQKYPFHHVPERLQNNNGDYPRRKRLDKHFTDLQILRIQLGRRAS